jgi:hypothetical protein
MVEFIAFNLYGRKLRYYSVDRIDMEFREIADDWRPVSIQTCGNYKQIQFNVDGKYTHLYLHRVIYYAYNQDWNIYDSSKNNTIDHRIHEVGVPLDNSITNLRVVNNQQNHFNRNAKGYYFNKKNNKYKSQIGVNGETIYLGYYDTIDEARNAYLEAKKSYHII